MERLKEIADSYLNGCLSETECARYLAVEIMQLKVAEIDTLAFLIFYGNMPGMNEPIDSDQAKV